MAAVDGTTNPTLLLLGDSRIAQWPMPKPAAGRIVNAGLSGATTARIALTARDLLEQSRPDVVVIEAGINDLKLAGARPDLRQKIVETAASNLERLVELCVSFRCKVIVLLVWPAAEPELLRRPVWNSAAVAGAVADLNVRLRLLDAPENGVLVCDLLVEAGGNPAYRDTLHLEPATYERLTPILQRRVEELRLQSKHVP
jgi:lysophospholipase L1-like esterase